MNAATTAATALDAYLAAKKADAAAPSAATALAVTAARRAWLYAQNENAAAEKKHAAFYQRAAAYNAAARANAAAVAADRANPTPATAAGVVNARAALDAAAAALTETVRADNAARLAGLITAAENAATALDDARIMLAAAEAFAAVATPDESRAAAGRLMVARGAFHDAANIDAAARAALANAYR